MTKPIKLIVVDLDGTLLNDQNAMSERNEKALKAAMDKGVLVMLATGKTRPSAVDIVERLNLTTPGIYVQDWRLRD
jgi:hydroxymethylpyrimidine pyrophosphatase-like HAD family hydrolase